MISRRNFLRRTFKATAVLAGTAGAAAAYGFWEASQIRVRQITVAVPNLPEAFAGKTIAVLADLHHGPYVGISFIRQAMQLANSLHPDLFALVGDYGHRGSHIFEELPPCLEALSDLQAPLGVFAVPGNHDMRDNGRIYRDLIRKTSLSDLTNRCERVTLDGQHLWLAGVDDLWWGKPDLRQALQGVPVEAAVVLLSHNPDFAERVPNRRVGLMLSGHTHGGQIYLPGIGADPWIPSDYGDKYRGGLVQAPASQVFVSRGLGEAGLPLRLNVPPEINVLTLMPKAEIGGK